MSFEPFAAFTTPPALSIELIAFRRLSAVQTFGERGPRRHQQQKLLPRFLHVIQSRAVMKKAALGVLMM
jgi:hypothetical protein